MKVAVTYKDGEIFQHFGHCEQFKLYTTDDNGIVSSEVVECVASGHDNKANFMVENSVDMVICGGIGEGALSALSDNGIKVISGVEGSADKAIEQMLIGELYSEGANCDHHNNEETDGCGCGSSCGGGCGSSCGGGCGCGSFAPDFEGPNVGKAVRVHYRGTFNDGTQFDSSYDRGETLDFVCGAGQMIKGFDKAVAAMKVGEAVDVHLMPNEAYGEKDPNAIFEIPMAQLPGSEELNVGESVYLTNAYGQPFPVTVVAKDEVNITFDANSEMAGKELNFHIELVEVK